MPDSGSPNNYAGFADVEQVWSSYDPQHPERVTVGTVFKMAANQGWINPRRGRTKAVSTSTAEPDLSRLPGIPGFKLADGDICIPTAPPPKRAYVFADTVVAGTYNVLAGSGGTSKTMLAMTVAAAMSEGRAIGDLTVSRASAMLFLGEEDSLELGRRFGALCHHFGYSTETVARYVKAFPAAGVDLRLTRMTTGFIDTTPLVQSVIDLVKQQEAESDMAVRLVVFDHARLVMDGDPDDAADVTQLTRSLTHIAQETGAAVLLLAHSPKSVLKQDAKEMSVADVAGSSAFSDNARAGFIMYGMREGDAKAYGVSEVDRHKYVKLECAKANYAPQGAVWWFERVPLSDWQTAVLQPVQLIQKAFLPGQRKQQLQQVILDAIKSKPGQTRRSIRNKAGTARTFAASEKEVLTALDDLLDRGLLDLRKPTAEEVKRLQLPRREALFSGQRP